ncbi:MAG: hypothetical protein M1435_03735, partial [Actinobacteria bacterium]|nr:hypothetical protein [Actinomycetota bacterium]
MQTASRQVGELLIERKVLSKDTLEYAMAKEAETGVPLAKILSAEGLVSERDLVAAVAVQLGIPHWDPTTTPISPLVEGLIPPEIARRQMVVAIGVEEDALLIATENPLDDAMLSAVSQATGWKPRPCLATHADIVGAQGAMYGAAPSASTAATFGDDLLPDVSINRMLARLVELRGSDLHLSAGLPPVVRIDGDLQPLEDFEILTPSKLRDLVYGMLPQRLRERFENDRELDTSHVVPGVGR